MGYPEKIKVKILECAKWRWEFVRRNPDYKKDYDRIRNQGKSTSQEKAFCDKWQIDARTMPNPSKNWEQLRKNSAEQLIEGFNNQNDAAEAPDDSQNLFKEFDEYFATRPIVYGGVRIVHGRTRPLSDIEINSLSEDNLVLHIDFSRINSLLDLKEYVSHIIDNQAGVDLKIETGLGPFGVRYREIRPTPIKVKKNRVDYATHLQAWDLVAEGKTRVQVAQIMFPTDCKNGVTEAETKRVQRYLNKCEELIFGGYKNITYP
ncbi:MAG: hypothetical protein HF981_04365 [Desulfobacteraceae bacterium]|nr:hypothetical protein [Desulfobacteraceae bacterium]MBC2749599.1 hypothetical protein [Desulfobacteraceae bacterium]